MLLWPKKEAVFVYKYCFLFRAITAWLKAEEESWAQGGGTQKDNGKTATARGPF